MFAVMNGFIIALILSSSSSRHQYKLKMDTIMASLLQHRVAAECTNAAGGCFNQWMLCMSLLLTKPHSRLCRSRQPKQKFLCKFPMSPTMHCYQCYQPLQETTDDKDLPEDLRHKIIQASMCLLGQRDLFA